MKNNSLIMLAMAALLMTACSKEEDLTTATPTAEPCVLSVSVEGNQSRTRVGFKEGGEFYWSKSDQLAIVTPSGSGPSRLTLSAGVGKASATFTGLSGDLNGAYAVYPYNENHSITDNTLKYNFPSKYTYENVDQDFFIKDATGNWGTGKSFNPAMMGKLDGDNVFLKHLGGVFCIKIEKMPLEAGQLIFSTDQPIAGGFTCDVASDPVLGTTTQEGATTDNNATTDNKTVTINFTNAVKDQPGVFYVPVPTGTYRNVCVKVKSEGSEQDVINAVAGTYIIQRRELKTLTYTSITAGSEPKNDLEAVNNALSSDSNTNVTYTGEVTNTNETPVITINMATESSTEVTKSLSLEKVGNDASITVKEEENTGPQNSGANFTLSIPNNETADYEANPLDVTIDMPNTTVTLAGNVDKATYGNVIAKTAANTLVISSGVTVKNLTVQQGNIRVNNGATLENVQIAQDGPASVIIYKEAGATIPGTDKLGENITVMDAAVTDLQKVAEEGGTYTLQHDMSIEEVKIIVPKDIDVTLDLNGKTLKAANNANITVYGTFTLTDSSADKQGSIQATQDYGTPYTTGIISVVGEKASMTMNSGNICAVRPDPANKGQFGIVLLDGGDFTITGGKIEAGWYAVSGNGNCSTQESLINIQGGELVSTADYAVYLPQSGKTTITGGTINGACGGIAIQRGELAISGEAKILSQDNGSTGDWTDGTGNLGNAALVVAAEYGDCTVSISGGTFSSQKNAAVLDKLNSKHKVSIQVTGGTFSDPNALQYLETNAKVTINLSKNYETDKPLAIPAGTNVTINLNEKTLTSTYASQSFVDGTALIQNGSINVKNTIRVRENGNLTLDKVTVTETTHTALQAQGPNVKLTVRNDSVIKGKYFGCSTNASNSGSGQTPTYGAYAVITLENSTFTSGETGFMNNVPATVTIDGCTFSGTCQGALLRGGKYTISNSTFTLDAEKDKNSYKDGTWPANSKEWADGNRCTYAAITIGNQENNSYQYPTIVDMTKVTATVKGAHKEQYSAVYVAGNQGEDVGVKWTYDKDCVFGDSGQDSVTYGTGSITVNGQTPTGN